MLEQRRSIWVAGTVLGLVCACPDGGGATASGGGFSAAGSGVVTGPATDGATTGDATTTTGDATTTTTGDATTGGDVIPTTSGETDTGEPTLAPVTVRLVPQPGVAGVQRVNLAVPLAPGQLVGDAQVKVTSGGAEVRAVARGLATHPDGSWRSVQVQFELEVAGELDVEVAVGEAPGEPTIALVAVEETLSAAGGPNVWALLPGPWLAQSGVAGPIVADSEVMGELAAWAKLCDPAKFGVDAFMAEKDDPDAWLHDRGTALYRGYARRGDLESLRSAYLETTLYFDGLTGAGPTTQIGLMDKVGDVKFYYAQNLALHYLLTGDDRFRERAEDIAETMSVLWVSPGYAGGADFWTERHAGFALLAYVWAMIVTDDQADEFAQHARTAAQAYLDVQETYPEGYDDPDARCFAHSAEAHAEDWGYWGCSPWFSAVLADALDQYATEIGGEEAEAARTSIVKLGRSIARDGLDGSGKPFFWMGVGDGKGEIDPTNQHWGESAYIVAMAWHHAGRSDEALRLAADALVAGMAGKATMPHARSFTWQCRSAAATPWFLMP